MEEQKRKLDFAIDHATKGLFKFRSYSSAEDKERVKQILGGQIYFSTREQLNDPFEMQLALIARSDSRQRLKGLVKAMRNVGDRIPLSPAKRLIAAERLSRKLTADPRVLETMAKRHVNRMHSACFLFCLSANRTHPLLWSHYADSHRGICIQFDHRQLPFAGAAKVRYDADFPTAVYPFDREDSEFTQKAVLTKARFWKYEEEFRLFSVRMGNATWHLGLSWDNEHLAQVSPSAIVGLTLGAGILPVDAEELIAHCRHHHPHLTIDRAKLEEKKFALQFAAV